MTKHEFLEKLNSLLSDIPKTERESAMQYYQEYFEEAEIGEYDNIPETMESPEVIAENIRAGLESDEQPEESYFKKEESTMARESGIKEKRTMDSSKIILLIILAIFTSPLWGGILISLAGLAIGILAAIFGIAVAVVAVMASFLVAGVVVIVVGAVKMVAAPIAGITAVGVGLLLFGIGLLLLILVIWSFKVLIPAFFHGINWLFQRVFRGKERGANEKVL